MKTKFKFFLLCFFIINSFLYGGHSRVLTKKERSKLIVKYGEIGKWDAAKKEINKYIELYPHDMEGYYYLAKLKYFLKDKDGAEKVIIEGLKKTNESPRLYHLEGTFYPKIDNQFALKMMEISLKAKPNNVRFLVDTSELNMMNGNYIRAIKLSKRAIELDPNEVKGYQVAAKSYLALKDFDHSKEFLNQGIKLKNNQKYWLDQWLYISAILGEYGTSIKIANQYNQLYGWSSHSIKVMGVAYYSLKNYNKAEKVFKVGVSKIKDKNKLTKKELEHYYGLGLTYLKQKNPEKAKKIFLKLNSIYPSSKITYYGLGETYFLEKKYSKAKKYFKYYLEYPLEDNNFFIDNNEVKVRLNEINKKLNNI